MNSNKKFTKCVLCKGKAEHLITKVKQPTKIFPTKKYKYFFKKNLNIFFCRKCTYSFQFPIPSKKQIKQFYKDEQSEYTSIINNPILGADKEKEKIDFIKKNIKKNISSTKLNIIEIGGFDGYTLKEVSKSFKNSKKYLIEPNSVGGKIAKKNNINVIQSYLDKKSIKNYHNLFDVVICKHVIEHVKDLENFIYCLTKLISNQGILFIETPNLEMIFKKSLTREFILQHLHYFSIKTLNKIFKNLSIKNYKNTKQENSLIVCFSKKKIKSKLKNINLNTQKFFKNLNKQKKQLNQFCEKNKHKNIWIYGASSSVNDIFTIYDIKKKNIMGIIDTDLEKTKMRIPILKDIKIHSLYDNKIKKDSAIIIVATAKNEVLRSLKINKFTGPKYIFQ